MVLSVFGFPRGVVFPLMLALVVAFSNGFRDSSSIVATIVSTGTLNPRTAFLLCSVCEFVGGSLLGSSIAITVGSRLFTGVSAGESADLAMILTSALICSFVWGLVSWWQAWPTSNNQALFAGICGAGSAVWKGAHLKSSVWLTLLVVLLSSPVVGFFVSVILSSGLRFLGGWLTVRARSITSAAHVVACLVLSGFHGSNDGQILMGLMALMVASAMGNPMASTVPGSIRVAVAAAVSIGVLIGGRRILKRLGMSFYRIRSSQGLAADLASASTLLACAASGFPASTTQVITGSILGAGAAENLRAVRWTLVRDVVVGWFVTLPSVALLSYLLALVIRYRRGL